MKKLLIIFLSVLSVTISAQTNQSDNSDIIRQVNRLSRNIAMEIGKIEGNMPQINILIKRGEKAQARAMVDEALLQIEAVEGMQKKISELSEDIDEEILMTSETQEAKNYLLSKANQLRNAISLCMQCDASLFGTNYSALLGNIQRELSEVGVSYVDEIEKADWAIYIQANATEHAKVDFGAVSNYAAFVEADVRIDQVQKEKQVHNSHLKSKICNHTNGFNKAATEAYGEIAKELSEIIKNQILK